MVHSRNKVPMDQNPQRNADTDGSSHCKLTIWQASSQNTQHCSATPHSRWTHTGISASGRSDRTQQSMSLMKHQDAASAQRADSIQTANGPLQKLLFQKQDFAPATKGWQHQSKIWQQLHKWASLVNLNRNKMLPQQQTTDRIRQNLQEEPSALQSLSIFDST
jgi:hypothetical protein